MFVQAGGIISVRAISIFLDWNVFIIQILSKHI